MANGYDRLTPEGKKFYAEIARLKENEVFVGYQAGKAKHKGNGKEVDMAQIAMFNELGTSNSPARPFLRQAYDDNKDRITEACGEFAKTLANGGSADSGLKKLGVFGVNLVQEKIINGSFTPNAPSTIKKKGSSRPLIDTGRMRQSVHYVIRKKGE